MGSILSGVFGGNLCRALRLSNAAPAQAGLILDSVEAGTITESQINSLLLIKGKHGLPADDRAMLAYVADVLGNPATSSQLSAFVNQVQENHRRMGFVGADNRALLEQMNPSDAAEILDRAGNLAPGTDEDSQRMNQRLKALIEGAGSSGESPRRGTL